MSAPLQSIAVDLGASSGRAVLGLFNGQKMTTSEVHRFSNDPVRVPTGLHWDILRLFHEVKVGMQHGIRAAEDTRRGRLHSMGIDSWAVDYGLLDDKGRLIGNPYHYRDDRTDHVMDQVFTIVPRRELFARTGIQMLPFNTVFQLYAEQRQHPAGWDFGEARTMLLIPDLLSYFLTGVQATEWTNATTTQLIDASTGQWDRVLMEKLGLPDRLMTEIIDPGTIAGHVRPAVLGELGLPTNDALPVVAVADHDTASAVVAIPVQREGDFAYLSSGTWSLLGMELASPQIDDRSYHFNFTNEGGFGRTARFLKNIMGLWILQECMRVWSHDHPLLTYETILAEAAVATPFAHLIDPDDSSFLAPGDMPRRIASFCQATCQDVPQSMGEMTRCVIESLALKYAQVLEQMEDATGRHVETLYIVGGGVSNRMLCQATADATGRTVLAGPSEATAIGNLIVQWIAAGELANLDEGRALVRSSWQSDVYEPKERSRWLDAAQRFQDILRSQSGQSEHE